MICIDRDLTGLKSATRFRNGTESELQGSLKMCQLDLAAETWPFGESSVGGIVNVHFFLPSLFSHFCRSLSAGGYLIFESVPGHGGNYLELPTSGYVLSLLTNCFEIEFYKERTAGPLVMNRAVTKVVAKRR